MTNQHPPFLRAFALLIGALLFTAAGTSGALACRGTAEYPQVASRLAAAPLPADMKTDLARQLDDGRAMHDTAHRKNDRGLMEDSLKMLDRIKEAL